MRTAAAPLIQGRIARVPVADDGRWQEHLEGVSHDFYHSAAYHRFCEETGAGQAFLTVYREGNRQLLWPYLLRPVPGFAAGRLYDVTSVYGYAGPLACGPHDAGFLARALRALEDLWRSQHAVSAFSRLHPLLENDRLFPAGAPHRQGQTVSINLARQPSDLWRDFRKSLRYDIRAARAQGVVIAEDKALKHLHQFSDLYHETMIRNSAESGYLFGRNYFRALFERLGQNARLMTAFWNGQLMGGAVVVACGDWLHYHFSATAGSALHLSPAKLLLDEIRLWGQERDYKVLHLGGGRGSRADSLFAFKAGFSSVRHSFYTWRSILEPALYCELSAIRRRGARAAGRTCSETFFPFYRSPDVPSPAAVARS